MQKFFLKILKVEVKAMLFVWNTSIVSERRIWPTKGNTADVILAPQFYLNRPVRIWQYLLGINKYKLLIQTEVIIRKLLKITVKIFTFQRKSADAMTVQYIKRLKSKTTDWTTK